MAVMRVVVLEPPPTRSVVAEEPVKWGVADVRLYRRLLLAVLGFSPRTCSSSRSPAATVATDDDRKRGPADLLSFRASGV